MAAAIFPKNVGMLSSFPVNLLCIFIVAAASYYWVEKPFFKLKDRLQFKPVGKEIHPQNQSIHKQPAASVKAL